MTVSRRRFLRTALAGCAGPLVLGTLGCRSLAERPKDSAAVMPPASSPTETEVVGRPLIFDRQGPDLLPVPDFSDEQVLRFVAGIRPYRQQGIRLEAEALGDKLLVHDYGHGGAGLTLSWGCAEEVRRLVTEGARAGTEVAVLGAGVSGLSVARELQRGGFGVHLYAQAFTPETTSDVAGGQWAPALVSSGRSREEHARFRRLLVSSHAAFTRLIGEEYGVSIRDNYTAGKGGGALARIPRGILPPVENLSSLPFPGAQRSGRLYRTLLIEPPRYLPRLFAEVKEHGIGVTRRSFADLEEILSLPEPTVVNCLGLGARDVLGDRGVTGVRGQLVHLKPQPIDYLLSHQGYIFPRSDAVVLGGSAEWRVYDPTPDPVRCQRILDGARRFFSG